MQSATSRAISKKLDGWEWDQRTKLLLLAKAVPSTGVCRDRITGWFIVNGENYFHQPICNFFIKLTNVNFSPISTWKFHISGCFSTKVLKKSLPRSWQKMVARYNRYEYTLIWENEVQYGVLWYSFPYTSESGRWSRDFWDVMPDVGHGVWGRYTALMRHTPLKLHRIEQRTLLNLVYLNGQHIELPIMVKR